METSCCEVQTPQQQPLKSSRPGICGDRNDSLHYSFTFHMLSHCYRVVSRLFDARAIGLARRTDSLLGRREARSVHQYGTMLATDVAEWVSVHRECRRSPGGPAVRRCDDGLRRTFAC
ncbi:hypothetical protein K523DRAFT_103568 [Schizophyllum commune Tattone D]|nr:hypothetical protein K523DRAFT_103568 [Schizophyllum commune Tattone D]